MPGSRSKFDNALRRFPEVPKFRLGERWYCLIIDQQDISSTDSGKQMAVASIGTSQGKLAKQRGSPSVEAGLFDLKPATGS